MFCDLLLRIIRLVQLGISLWPVIRLKAQLLKVLRMTRITYHKFLLRNSRLFQSIQFCIQCPIGWFHENIPIRELNGGNAAITIVDLFNVSTSLRILVDIDIFVDDILLPKNPTSAAAIAWATARHSVRLMLRQMY